MSTVLWKSNIFGFSNFTRQCSNTMQVRGKSVSYIHREFSNKSNAERILKISSHLPKCGIVFTGTPCRISALCKCRNNTKALKRTQTYHKASLLYCSETAGPIELHLERGLALTNAMLLDAGGWGGVGNSNNQGNFMSELHSDAEKSGPPCNL